MEREKFKDIFGHLANIILANKQQILKEWEKSFLTEIAESSYPVTPQAIQAIELVKEYIPGIIEGVISIFRLQRSEMLLDKEKEHFHELGNKVLLQELYNQDLNACFVRLATIILEFGEPFLKNDKDYLSEAKNVCEIIVKYFEEILLNGVRNRLWMIHYPVVREHYHRVLDKNTKFFQDSGYSLKHITTLGNYALAETGIPLGIYWSNDRSLIVITSHLFEHPWSARYIIPVSYRVCIYKSADLSLFRVFDQATACINHIVFHPSDEFIIIGCGHYPGGGGYNGELWRWNIVSGDCVSIFEHSIGVLNCSFDLLGENIEVTHCYENHFYEDDSEIYARFIVERFTLTPKDWQNPEPLPLKSGINRTILDQFYYPIDRYNYKFENQSLGELDKLIKELESIAKSKDLKYEPRWVISDLVWTHSTGLLATRNNTALEQWGNNCECKLILKKPKDGVQIILTPDNSKVYINFSDYTILDGSIDFSDSQESNDMVESINLSTSERMSLTGLTQPVLLIPAKSGYILARSCKHSSGDTNAQFITPTGEVTPSFFVGNYDYLYVKEAEEIYILQATPPTTTKDKWICSIDPVTYKIERLFPLQYELWSPIDLFTCTGVFIKDEKGNSLILSTQKYDGYRDESVIMRRSLPKGETVWAIKLKDYVIAIVFLPQLECVVLSLNNGNFGAIDAKTGEILYLEKVFINNVQTVITSLATLNNKIAAGTIDGRIIIYQCSRISS